MRVGGKDGEDGRRECRDRLEGERLVISRETRYPSFGNSCPTAAYLSYIRHVSPRLREDKASRATDCRSPTRSMPIGREIKCRADRENISIARKWILHATGKPNNKAAIARRCARNTRYPQNVLCVEQSACVPAFRGARMERALVSVIRVRIKSEWRLNQVDTILTVWLKCPAHIALSKRRRQRCAFNRKLLKMGAGRTAHGWRF